MTGAASLLTRELTVSMPTLLLVGICVAIFVFLAFCFYELFKDWSTR